MYGLISDGFLKRFAGRVNRRFRSSDGNSGAQEHPSAGEEPGGSVEIEERKETAVDTQVKKTCPTDRLR